MTLMRFKLLAGSHSQTKPEFVGKTDDELRKLLRERGDDFKSDLPRSRLLERLGALETFRADHEKGFYPTVESADDLERRYGRAKFARIHDDAAPREVERVVERKVYFDPNEATEDQLREYAAEEEIDIEGCDTREKVLKAIRSARRGAAAK